MALTDARWVPLAAAVASILFSGVVRAETVSRPPGQTDDDFVAHALGGAGKAAQLAQKVVRSTELASGKNTLVGFVSQDNQPLAGHLLIETTSPAAMWRGTRPSY